MSIISISLIVVSILFSFLFFLFCLRFTLIENSIIQVDRVFKKLDLNQDGVITIEEFLEACLKDDLITKSLEMFDKGLWWQSCENPTKINNNLSFTRRSFKRDTTTLIHL